MKHATNIRFTPPAIFRAAFASLAALVLCFSPLPASAQAVIGAACPTNGYYSGIGPDVNILSCRSLVWTAQLNIDDTLWNTLIGSANTAFPTGNANTGVGFSALGKTTTGTSNTAIGSYALWNNTTGGNNTAVGYAAFDQNTSGATNVAMGVQALYSSLINSESVAIGNFAMRYANNNAAGPVVTYNTAVGTYALQGPNAAGNTGTSNTAIGHSALGNTTGGSQNVAVGYQTLWLNTTASFNTAVGISALRDDTTGGANTAVGSFALVSNTGGQNTAVGSQAGYVGIANTTGNQNTFIGANAQTNGAAYTNATALGYGAIVTASNMVRIGNASVTSITGQVAWAFPSDRRLKKDIKDSDLGLDFIEKLRPVSYRLKTGNGRLDYGFIAQEVEKALDGRITNMVTQENDKMKTYRMRGNDLIAPLVKAVQQQQQLIVALRADTKKQQKQIDALETTIQRLARSRAHATAETAVAPRSTRADALTEPVVSAIR